MATDDVSIPAPTPTQRADPVSEGLAIVVETGSPSISLLACKECGVLLWDVEAHWTDAHAHRLQAIRARNNP
jgi:hypothetical protein